ncbi:glycosyltransferase family 4 protein [Burkholderia stagnalis]|uniref:glycosyltransferase family 4 protein n=1 Tax=Burkholderia stagnalis TaxID=1503054 RepID=UPI0007592A75|nr:glycosyltransferase family 4 protein [Burkholderia stagnalis]AOK56086.1 glycosyl transferase [Burkholderia stagnalis]KVC57750.1 glycosyl transferase [Burkholderia stagnalis]KVN19130.1 glycosyl transferase [Burkholderia stagnalis]KVN84162.1 glycosyl transferase [Burkholderia stagnalis]KWI67368.1 glycosyl transferase [Burkholderia stagnalis]
MKIAIVHDWLVAPGGAEHVLAHMIDCFPQADVHSLVDFLEDRTCLRGRPVRTSFIQKLPFARTRYRSYLPLFPLAIEQFDLSAYDIVLSSSYAVAKGVLCGPDQLHASYVHSPVRYAWDLQHQYLNEAGLARGPKSALARVLLHYIRNWDARSANGVDCVAANSRFIARRIRKTYRRDATVIHPPVDVDRLTPRADKEAFFLTASRLVPYKRIDLIVEAFSRTPWRRLVVIGDGPERAKIRALAGPNVTLLGYQPFEVLHDHLQRACAFVFAAEEDFGIAPVEAQACGTPVIAYGKGGVRESVRAWPCARPTGLFYRAQTADALVDALARFDALPRGTFAAHACRENAERFGAERFRAEFTRFVLNGYAALQEEMAGAVDAVAVGAAQPDDLPAAPARHDDAARLRV